MYSQVLQKSKPQVCFFLKNLSTSSLIDKKGGIDLLFLVEPKFNVIAVF